MQDYMQLLVCIPFLLVEMGVRYFESERKGWVYNFYSRMGGVQVGGDSLRLGEKALHHKNFSVFQSILKLSTQNVFMENNHLGFFVL